MKEWGLLTNAATGGQKDLHKRNTDTQRNLALPKRLFLLRRGYDVTHRLEIYFFVGGEMEERKRATSAHD